MCSNRMDASSLGIRNYETVEQAGVARQLGAGKASKTTEQQGRHSSGLLQERDEHSE